MYKNIPKMDTLLEEESIKILIQSYSLDLVKKSINLVLDEIRNDIKNSKDKSEILDKIKNISLLVKDKIKKKLDPKLKKVINATGTILHTNLGRALYPKDCIEEISEILTSYSNLEYNLEEGKRGLRYSHIEDLICEITGAESAMVVNNNASAVLLVLSTFAKNKDAIISRGELIEIGGSFRIPEVMKMSGTNLVEVGTTNKTHIQDYLEKIDENTGIVLKVHTSNYKIIGFTESVDAKELSSALKEKNIIFYEDLGSGVLINLEKYNLSHEPTVQESLLNGVDIVSFSGDKLLGGPQAGIIVGKKELIEKIRKNHLTRALRVDKVTIKMLEIILKRYLLDDFELIPTIKMLKTNYDELKESSRIICEKINSIPGYFAEIREDYSEIGGGSLPGEKLKTSAVYVKHSSMNENLIQTKLRHLTIPIIGRVNETYFIIDPRTLLEEDFDILINALEEINK